MRRVVWVLYLFIHTSCLLAQEAGSFPYRTASVTLKNGLKVIVCEKPDNAFAQIEVWYRTGSKDEKPGIRGMAHLFEHMMFRGTRQFPKDAFDSICDKVGAENNAYTTYDRTVYHEYIPASYLGLFLQFEADRMTNLVVTQNILNIEREVVGEELRNSLSNWYGKLQLDRYPYLFPEGHPYEVEVIGNLNEITAFTAEQCMEFYNHYYSPNNAYLIVVGNVKSDTVFALAEKHFSSITKQSELKKREQIPDLLHHKIKKQELPVDKLVQIYSYIFPRPAYGDKDLFAMNMLTDILFTDDNSILQNRLMKKEYLAYYINSVSEDWNLYTNLGMVDIIMPSFPGNVKVKKIVKEEISKIIEEGIPQDRINRYIQSMEAKDVLRNYTAEAIAYKLGLAEYYDGDYRRAFSVIEDFKKITREDIRRVAAKYLAEDKIQLMNIKPMN